MKRINLLVVSLVIFLLFVPNAGAQTPKAAVSPCDANPEYRRFDFWVGEWDVFNPKGEKAGTNRIERILSNCVLLENWTGSRGLEGKSFNLYNAAAQKWEQVWVDASGSILKFEGQFRDGNLHYTGESATKDGGKLLHKLTFFPRGPDEVRQLWEQSSDGGKTWTVVFDGKYVRRK